ncbi:hypothetical protein CCOS2040_17765 [Streptomyces albidoflavus]|nr:hypothetical protein CCOS2040_17765 [Streptomyces albidoflavus]
MAATPSAALGALHPRRPAPTAEAALTLLVLAALLALLAADLSGMSKAETERIWQPFYFWLLPATALLPVGAAGVAGGAGGGGAAGQSPGVDGVVSHTAGSPEPHLCLRLDGTSLLADGTGRDVMIWSMREVAAVQSLAAGAM